MYEVQCFKCMLVEDGAPVKLPVAHLSSSDSTCKLLSMLAKGADREHFWVVYLNGSNEITGYEEAGRGGLHGCALAPVDVLRGAILHGASAIILGHNHPSNDPSPSSADISMTKKVKEIAAELGICLFDHVIVTGREGNFQRSSQMRFAAALQHAGGWFAMIKGYCRTNLDEYKNENWPKEFVALPRIGDSVESDSGKLLRVVGVTHSTRSLTPVNPYPKPYIKVELHHD